MNDAESERRGLPARAAEVLREEGPKALWIRALQHAGVYRRLVVVSGRIPPRTRPAVLDRIACARLGPEEIGEYHALRPDQDPEETRRRLAAGHRCFVGRWDGRMVIVRWAGLGRIHVDYMDCDLVLADGVSYSYDLYVDPAFRGEDLPAALGFFARPELRADGYPRRVSLLWPENRKAHRRSRRRGHRHIGELVRWRIGGLRRYVLTMQEEPGGPTAWLPAETGRTRIVPPPPRGPRAHNAAPGPTASDGSPDASR